MSKLILPKEIEDKRKLEAKSKVGVTIGLDGKTILLKNKSLEDWSKFLNMVTGPNNPDNLPPAMLYVHQGFRDLVGLIMNHQEDICQILTSKTSSSSTKSSTSPTQVQPDLSPQSSSGESTS